MSTTDNMNARTLKNITKVVIDGLPWVSHPGTPYKTCYVDVNPELAAAILENMNTNNRDVSKRAVDEYTQDMLNGTWTDTNDSITFTNTYRLLNGQHRLLAVVLSNKTIRFPFQFGISSDAYKNMDCSFKRNGASRLKIAGVSGPLSKISSLSTALFEYQADCYGSEREKATRNELLKIAERWRVEFTASANWVKNLNKYRISSADAAFAHFCIMNGNFKQKGSDFINLMTSVIHGEIAPNDLGSSHPVIALLDEYQKLIGLKLQDAHLVRIGKGAMMMEAFDNFRNDVKFRRFTRNHWTTREILGDFEMEIKSLVMSNKAS